MAFALVGSAGTAVQTTSGAALTTATFGTNEYRTPGNLLLFFVTVTGSATLPGTPSGWDVASQVAGTSCSATIYSRVATGLDTAPTISAITSGLIAGHLEEWSGGTIKDRGATNTGTSSPVTATQGAANVLANELVVLAAADVRSVARASNDTWTSNHGTPTLRASNNGVSSTDHYSHATLISNSAASADTGIVTLSITTSITGIAVAMVSFLLGATVTPQPKGGLSYEATVIDDNPRTYYRMGEPSGSVIDTRGGSSGTASGTLTRDVAGALVTGDDGAIALAGTGYITVPSQAPLDTGDTFSLECWVKRAGTGAGSADRVLFQKVSTYEVLFDSGGSVDKIGFQDYGNVQLATSSTTITDTTTWHHIVCTKATTTSKIYIDGVDRTTTGTNGTVTDSANGLGIGGTTAGLRLFNGSMDEVAVYATALSATRVTAHYDAGVAAVAPGLLLTFYAPTVTVAAAPIVATPPTLALTIATFAPVVAHSIVGASPTALVLATFAPAIGQGVVPSLVALTLTAFAPTVTAGANQVATAGLVTLALATFAPTVTASDHKTATPPVIALTLSTFAPTVTPSDHQLATPPTLALALSTFAPTVTASDPKLVTPGLVTLVLSTFAPSAFVPVRVTPDAVALIVSGLAPTLVLPVTVTPDVLALTLETFEPVTFVPDPVLVTLGLLELVLSGLAPMPNVGHPMSPSFIAGVDMVPVATASVSVVESPAVTVAFDEQEVSVTWAT